MTELQRQMIALARSRGYEAVPHGDGITFNTPQSDRDGRTEEDGIVAHTMADVRLALGN